MKEKKSFIAMAKLGVILALYAAAACVGLAFVYAGTIEKIEENSQQTLNNALKELFPYAESFNPIEGISSSNPAVIIEAGSSFEVIQNNNVIGLALRTSRSSYSGPIKLLVGIGVDNTIKGIKVLENIDTPGLGANASKPQFYSQFAGKSVNDPFIPKQDVDAITAATITTTAVSDSVKTAGIAAMTWFADTRGNR